MFFLIWITWPFMGHILWLLFIKIFGDQFDIILGAIVLYIWAYLWSIPLKKLKALRCPKCSQRNAIRYPPVLMKHAKCQHCRLEYQEN